MLLQGNEGFENLIKHLFQTPFPYAIMGDKNVLNLHTWSSYPTTIFFLPFLVGAGFHLSVQLRNYTSDLFLKIKREDGAVNFESLTPCVNLTCRSTVILDSVRILLCSVGSHLHKLLLIVYYLSGNPPPPPRAPINYVQTMSKKEIVSICI